MNGSQSAVSRGAAVVVARYTLGVKMAPNVTLRDVIVSGLPMNNPIVAVRVFYYPKSS
jgi:hypothetical protein